MRKGMTPARNRALFPHLMDSTLDFQDWLTRNLGILTPGLTPNPWTGGAAYNSLVENHASP